MLDVFEVKNLEERWKKYKRKKNIKIFILIFIFFAVISGLVYYIGFFNKKDIVKVKSKKNIVLVKKESMKVIKKSKKLPVPIEHIYTEDNKTKNKKNITNIKKKNDNHAIKKDNNNNIKKKNNYNTKSVDILHLDKKFLKQIYTNDSEVNMTKINNLSSNLSSNNDNKNIATEKIEQKNKKTKIIISSKRIDKLKYFKDQYKISGKVLYAILISKEYYKKKLYKKSLKWAIIANSIDSSNEDSWIIFAKNKVKLHQKNDAINALQAYLRVNSSKKIEILLSNIKNGVFK